MDTQEQMECDVVIVGGGPAGLSAAIRLKQLCQQNDTDLSVCVLEKSAEIGGHIVSGAVFDPRALNELLPDWQDMPHPLNCPVQSESFQLLTQHHAWRLPTPPQMRNHGHYIVSLGVLCRFLAERATELGVDIFPGFPGRSPIIENNTLQGIRTDGMDIRAKCVLIAEGARGSLARELIQHFKLDNTSPQTYGLGIKEIWEVDSSLYKPGHVNHTVGWPLDHSTYGGGFIYHSHNHQVSIGFVVGLDYHNPTLSPFDEMQRFKTHPAIAPLLKNGRRIAYGARALTEGGYQSIPKLSFPGGYLIGCAAGFMDVPKIKGSHTAMKSGMLGAEAAFTNITQQQSVDLNKWIDKSWVGRDLYRARNIRPGFHRGLMPGLLNAAFETYVTRGHSPWTLKNNRDNESLQRKPDFKKIDYPKPDNQLTFDILTSLPLTGVNHDESSPCHLHLKNRDTPIDINLKDYDSPEQYYCPAKVYEIVGEDLPRLQINSQNCIHCKTCDIKDPMQNIIWVPPKGGDGPNYGEM